MATSLLIAEHPLQVLPKLATAIGLNEAIVLQQFQYLSGIGGKTINGEKWVYDTYEELQKKFFPFWSIQSIQRIVLSLEKSGWLLSCQPEGVISRRKYYRISNQTRIHLTMERVDEMIADKEGEKAKSRTPQIDTIVTSSWGVPLTEIPKPEITEQKEQTLDLHRAGGFSEFLPKKPAKAKGQPPTWEDVEKHADLKRINLSAALRFFNLNQTYGWKSKSGPIRNWKYALDGYVKAEPLYEQDKDTMTNDEFWAWARNEFDEDEIEHVGPWVKACIKNNWMKTNAITGQPEPISDFKRACRSFVDECVEMKINR